MIALTIALRPLYKTNIAMGGGEFYFHHYSHSLSKTNMGGGEERGEESDHTHRYSTPAFQNKYAGRGGGGGGK